MSLTTLCCKRLRAGATRTPVKSFAQRCGPWSVRNSDTRLSLPRCGPPSMKATPAALPRAMFLSVSVRSSTFPRRRVSPWPGSVFRIVPKPICSDDGRHEAVIRCVGQRERLLVVSERRDHCDRAKAFFVKGRHSRCHPGDYRRFKEESLAGAAGQHFRALCNCLGDDPLDICGLTLVDDRADLYLLVEGITDDEGPGLSHEGFGIGVSNALVDEVAAGGEADLSLVKEGSPGARAGCGLDVRIV